MSLPHDLDAERSVLGAVLVRNEAMVEATKVVGVDDFFRDANLRIFRAMGTLAERGEAIDLITVKGELQRTGEVDTVGGPAYIASLADGVPRSTNVAHYARIVHDLANRRRLIDSANKAIRAAQDDPDSLPAAVSVLAVAGSAIATDATQDSSHERRVVEALQKERARRDAISRLEEQEHGAVVIPAFETLAERLSKPRVPMEYRVEGLQARNHRVMLAAQFKAGKSTMRNAYMKSLADGEPFLGRFNVERPAGAIVCLDAELNGGQGDDWLRDVGIKNAHLVMPVYLRGQVASFNILNPRVRREWARRLRDVSASVLVVDCLRPFFDEFGLDEKSEAGRFLVPLDALLDEAGIGECLVVHHMGHSGDRSRGDSKLRDWPDAEWRLTRKDEDPASPRYFSAFGRDVDLPETAVHYDPLTRQLTLGEGSRADAKTDDAVIDIVEFIAKTGPACGREVVKVMKKNRCRHSKGVLEAALRRGILTGALKQEPGKFNARIYHVGSVPVSRSVPAVSQDSQESVSQCPSAYIGTGHRTLDVKGNHDRF